MHQDHQEPTSAFAAGQTRQDIDNAERAEKLKELRRVLAAVRSSKRGSFGGYGKAQLAAISRLKREISDLERGRVGKGHALTPEGQAKLTAIVGDLSKPFIERQLALRILRRHDMTFTGAEGERIGLLVATAA